jgi:Putative DNA-binding domain
VEPELSVERLRSLLDEQAESSDLDFKESCDINATRDFVKLTKHVGAMLVRGGHIVVGADNNGRPSGQFSESQAKLFDEAILRAKLLRYLPASIEVRCAVHELDGQRFGLIRVSPHLDGLVPFTRDGSYEENGRTVSIFRKGQIYARHGTSSEPCDQNDVHHVLEQQLERDKESLRAERAAELALLLRDLQAQTDIARAPASTLTFQLDEETFLATIVEQLRVGDDIPLRLLLQRARDEAGTAVTSGDPGDIALILDRLGCLAVTFATLDRVPLFHQVVDTLVEVYNIGFDERGMTRLDLTIDAPRLWLLVIQRVMVVGAALVRLKRWELATALVLQRGSGYEFTERKYPYVTWIRHTTTEASRAGHYDQLVDGKRSDVSLLWLAKEVAEGSLYLSRATGADDDSRLDAICQFDILAMLAALGASGSADTHHYYPHFARFYEHRSLPILERAIIDPDVRSAVFPHRTDQELADVIRWINHAASQEGFRFAGWDGYLNDIVRGFLEQHPPPQE